MLNRSSLKIILVVLVFLTALVFKADRVYSASCTGSCTTFGWGSSSPCAQSCYVGGIHNIPALIITTPVQGGCWTEEQYDPQGYYGPGCLCTCDNSSPPPPPDPITCGSNQALVSINGGSYTSSDQNVHYGDTVSIKPNPLSGRTASLSRAADGYVGLSCSDLTNTCPASTTITNWWGGLGSQVLLTTFQHTADNWWEVLGDCQDTLTLTIRTRLTCNPLKWGAWSACSATCGPGTQTRTNACGTDQTQSCMVNDPNIWSAWSACTPACGSGTQTRTNQCGTVDSQSCTNGACIPSWYQSVGGDVYGNGVNSSVSTAPPVGFKGFLATKSGSNGNVFSKGNIDAGGDLRISESKVYVKNIEANGISGLWPQGGFTPPSSAVAVSNCSGMFTDSGVLDPARAYKADSTCIQTGLNTLGSAKYKLSGNGVAVIYVTGNTPIKFSNSFNSSSANKKIIIVSNPKIIIGGTLGSISPDKTKPDIEAVLISNTEIYFESLADLNNSVYDKSIVIEGSVISPVVTFLRNTGTSNYPAEVFVYNSYYLTQLLQQEKNLGYINYTGLMVQESAWGNTQ